VIALVANASITRSSWPAKPMIEARLAPSSSTDDARTASISSIHSLSIASA